MLTNLAKRIKLKKPFQVIFKQSLLKVIQSSAKNIFKQFLKAKIFDNLSSPKNNFNFVITTINNKSKKIYIKIKFELNDDLIYNLTNNRR